MGGLSLGLTLALSSRTSGVAEVEGPGAVLAEDGATLLAEDGASILTEDDS